MNAKKRNRFWQLHSLLGIIFGLPLFVIFVAGTLAFFEPQAINWTQPQYQAPPSPTPALNPTVQALLEEYPQTEELTVVFPTPDHPVVDFYLEENHEFTHIWADPSSPLSTQLATDHDADIFHFFIDLHYLDFILFGQELTGLIASLFFAIILTGIIYQWRSIKRDASPKNLSLKSKNRWKNIHRFSSLITLPFQTIYSITGATLTLGLFLAAPAIYLFFDGDSAALNKSLFPGQVITASPSPNQIQFPLDQTIATATEQWPEDVNPRSIQFHNHPVSDTTPASKTIIIQGKQDGTHFIGTYLLTLDGDLNILHNQTPTSHMAPMMIESIVNLHFGSFGNFIIKSLFILTGLIVSLSIAAGVLIFLKRRQQGNQRYTPSNKLLKLLTYWLIGGLPLALASSLHAAQLIPAHPVDVFIYTITLSLICTFFYSKSLSILSTLAAIAFLLLPLSFAIAHHQSPFQSGSTHANLVTSFNIFFVLTGSGIAYLAISLKSTPHTNTRE
ncbi:MAG: PepSY-associated TM helix domain-containing protein [Akkermansiaceae bacterium]